MLEAFLRMDKLEHAARTLFFASILEDRKTPAILPENEIRKMEALK